VHGEAVRGHLSARHQGDLTMLRFNAGSSLRAMGATLALLAAQAPVKAQDASYNLTIHEDRFEPASLEVKAGTKFKLVVKNARKVAAEFESHELNREKVIAAGASATINVGPLKAGSYPIFDDFKKSTKGQIVAK
jgi:plastocyanin